MRNASSFLGAEFKMLVWTLLILAHCVTAHYVFSRFMFNNGISEQWQYVRNLSLGQARDSGLWDQYMPFYELDTIDIRCGRGASASGPGTSTATVTAGDEVGFVIGRSADEFILPYVMYHNGPGFAYLSKSPSNVELDKYEGDGDWFKIAYFGPLNDTYWSTRDQTGMNFTIPPTTPPGKYLLRVEHLYVRPQYNNTQFYIACAQIEVMGPGGGTPGPLVRFPGAYKYEDPGIFVEQRIYDWPLSGLLTYQPPGPPVWRG
ncbi:glycosyl hydrolase family 61-domain-containing protein [Lophiotrema nucula]|uniref:lytic cellulose monooxygenase (C4-dehydrogenating) n=1 Tax=Lophiotrema nucula TaxID=690887 RepID=A0A6A5ZRF3_9PLEO|nr:glycosyl hydrolase family 61-domain-containing protein [Lophiotrema nucula]